MRPPQERATSSGCGATKTWVMAGRVYRALPARDSEPAAPGGPASDDEGQRLVVARTDGDDEPTSLGELVAQLVRDRWRRSRHDDPVPWRAVAITQTAVGRP